MTFSFLIMDPCTHGLRDTSQNGDKSQTVTCQNGDRPKRRQIKTETRQNGDNQNSANQNGACRRFGVSLFWIQSKWRHV